MSNFADREKERQTNVVKKKNTHTTSFVEAISTFASIHHLVYTSTAVIFF